MSHTEFTAVPVIDILALTNPVHGTPQAKNQVAAQIYDACKNVGFFYITNHGVSQELQDRLESLSREFFALPVEEKLRIDMNKGGKAWRGFFKVGDELTSGKPDGKEGIYLGEEIEDATHPKVKAGVPLHGRNLFPERPVGLKHAILEYFAVMKDLGHTLMRGIALSLSLEENFFEVRYTNDPLCLFRIFNYPVDPFVGDGAEERWGVGEHTDYGVLTILKQDMLGGLFVKNRVPEWIPAPPIPNTFVINIGDMLEKMTKGLYRSTPHRVKNTSSHDRISFPFFFDPNFDVVVQTVPLTSTHETFVEQERRRLADDERWDKASVHTFNGTYGDYVLGKVSKVFPQLASTNITN